MQIIYQLSITTILIFCLSMFSISCSTSPTGRPQLKLLSESELDKMGQAAYQDLKQKTPQSNNASITHYVKCIANAITKEVNSNVQWEVTVFEDDAVNAFALPGGKIGVYTGLLKVTENQHQLAAVMAHEVAHVTAHHANSRMSAAYVTGSGVKLAQVIAGAVSPGKQQLVGLLGVGAQYGVLMPFGRGQESEADILGLEYMAKAGFDPKESIPLWQNMAKQGGSQPPEFLSTHPSNQTRINDLSANIPNALKTYNRARSNGKKPSCG